MNDSLFAGMICSNAGDLVGNVGIHSTSVKNREGSLVINILPQYSGKGYATEVLECVLDHAFKNLALHRISLGVFEKNAPALALYRKLWVLLYDDLHRQRRLMYDLLRSSRGFVEEGRLRKAHWLDGTWQDTVLMTLLEEEWAERCAKQQEGS